MRVLVACEFSGRVRDAFIRRGHQAVSCDLLPSEGGVGGVHLQCDIFEAIKWGTWDLMIGFPPCTYLSKVGAGWWGKPGRAELQEAALEFVFALTHADIPKIAIENPVGRLSTAWRRPNQIVHPWWFGEPYRKMTCLWLKNLPELVPSNPVAPTLGPWVDSGTKYNPHGVRNQKDRSLTFRGMAEAMAEQWGGNA
jgi:hypothetical protein